MEHLILMADVIGSRKKKSIELIADFKKIVNYVNHKWSKEILSPLTITLGDEFQGVIDSTENAIKVIFEIEEEIINNNQDLKLRYVINKGKIDTPINKNIAYEMLGEGLTSAREKLTGLKKGKSRFLINTRENTQSEEIINDLFNIYQNYLDSWKKSDHYIVKQFLSNKSYQEVAENLDINISSSWRRKKSLNIEEYTICKKLILNLNNMLYV